MPPILQPVKDADMPEFLTIGHVTRDLHPDGSFSLGGTATFAALTTYRLGLVAAIVTRADSGLLAELSARLAGICLAASPSPATTKFLYSYQHSVRIPYLRARAGQLLRVGVAG